MLFCMIRDSISFFMNKNIYTKSTVISSFFHRFLFNLWTHWRPQRIQLASSQCVAVSMGLATGLDCPVCIHGLHKDFHSAKRRHVWILDDSSRVSLGMISWRNEGFIDWINQVDSTKFFWMNAKHTLPTASEHDRTHFCLIIPSSLPKSSNIQGAKHLSKIILLKNLETYTPEN